MNQDNLINIVQISFSQLAFPYDCILNILDTVWRKKYAESDFRLASIFKDMYDQIDEVSRPTTMEEQDESNARVELIQTQVDQMNGYENLFSSCYWISKTLILFIYWNSF